MQEKTLEQRLKKIEDFFSDMTIEEFEKISLECGIGKENYVTEYALEIDKKYSNFEGKCSCKESVFVPD